MIVSVEFPARQVFIQAFLATVMNNKKKDVMTAIDDITNAVIHVVKSARKCAMLVSPYLQIQVSRTKKWNELESAVKAARKRGVTVTFIARAKDAHNRKDAMTVLKPFREIGCSVFVISHLHAKIYYNEHECLVSSMNLYLGSTVKNHEIGVMLRDEESLQEIRDYICNLVGMAEKKSVGGKRVVSRKPAPTGTKETWFKVTKKGTKYYTIKLEGKYTSRMEIKDIGKSLIIGKEYNCHGTVKWITIHGGKKRVYLNDVTGIKAR
jgi:phosphatidylserine/phosphatidylglycerophosphate/cardiolipin synthase-like enzyme